MNIQQKREAIRKACIKANPEIVELKFGCVIQMTGAKQPDHIKTPVPITSVKPIGNSCWETPWGCFHPRINKGEYTIIGRPIRLADVLSTFTNEEQTDWTTDAALDIPGKWNLRKDDLIDQDDSTIDFIYDLIKEV